MPFSSSSVVGLGSGSTSRSQSFISHLLATLRAATGLLVVVFVQHPACAVVVLALLALRALQSLRRLVEPMDAAVVAPHHPVGVLVSMAVVQDRTDAAC